MKRRRKVRIDLGIGEEKTTKEEEEEEEEEEKEEGRLK